MIAPGLISLLLLAIAEVLTETIAEDYLLSARNLRVSEANSVTVLEKALSGAGTTAYQAIASVVAIVGDDFLVSAGVTSTTIAKLRALLR